MPCSTDQNHFFFFVVVVFPPVRHFLFHSFQHRRRYSLYSRCNSLQFYNEQTNMSEWEKEKTCLDFSLLAFVFSILLIFIFFVHICACIFPSPRVNPFFYVVLCSAFAKHLKIFFHFFRRSLEMKKCICSCRAQKIIRHFFLLCTFSFFFMKCILGIGGERKSEWVKMHVQGRIIFVLYLPPFHDLFFRLRFHGCAIFYQIFLASQSLLLSIF